MLKGVQSYISSIPYKMKLFKVKYSEANAIRKKRPIQVRVDFYCYNGRIYFGELTFFHNGGVEHFNPSSYDLYFGKKWRI